jgi:hypothetical protein
MPVPGDELERIREGAEGLQRVEDICRRDGTQPRRPEEQGGSLDDGQGDPFHHTAPSAIASNLPEFRPFVPKWRLVTRLLGLPQLPHFTECLKSGSYFVGVPWNSSPIRLYRR